LKNIIRLGIATAFSCSLIFSASAQDNTVYGNIWALGGSYSIARGDVVLPVVDPGNSMSYLDLQGEVGADYGWYTGLGAGYRRIVNNNQIYGGYLFIDRNQSPDHNEFWVLNPGFETMSCNCDFRINGYIPVSERSKKSAPFNFNFGCVDTSSIGIEFEGHQEFQHRFVNIEEVGPGADIEVGHKFNCGAGVYGGAYAFYLADTTNIRGVESRLELPVRGNVIFTTEASYDNYEHARVVAGFRVQLDKPIYRSPSRPCICNRMHEPVMRNLGSVGRGTGIPVVKDTKDIGRFLIRDNIYFFTTNGGVPFAGINTGTYLNPLAADQFNQTTINGVAGISPNANFFLAPGTYTITPDAPNGRISFANGQSVYGRSPDYTRSAFGAERAQVLGGFDLLEGNNTLSSIRLLDQKVGHIGLGDHVTALSIQNADNIHLCNDDINATVSETAVLTGENLATAINANNSNVTITSSTIEANALATAANTGALPVNSAMGIGGIVALTSTGNTSSNNHFTITDSAITSLARINAEAINTLNLSLGIGTIDAPFLSTNLNNAFDNNVYTLTNTVINTRASSGIMTNESDNLAVGIGAISGHIPGGLNTFNNNDFTLTATAVEATAVLPALGNLNSFNGAIGFGSSSGFRGNNQVSGNTLHLNYSTMQASSTALEGIANNGEPFLNDAIGIGSDAFASGTSNFDNNIIDAKGTAISADATLMIGASTSPTRNLAAGIGATTFGGATSTFDNNTFTGDTIAIHANATITNDQLIPGSLNEAIGIGIDNSIANTSFDNNDFSITKSILEVEALIQGDNAATNRALGLFAGNGTVIDFLDGSGSIAALINGTNTGTNTALATQTAGTGVIDTTGTTLVVTQNP
jgi:hypothetical protein